MKNGIISGVACNDFGFNKLPTSALVLTTELSYIDKITE